MDRNTARRILNDRGIEAAPERKRQMLWKTFLNAHWDTLTALDFVTIEVLTLAGIIRYHVLLVIGLKTQEVQIVGIRAQPCEKWMQQMAVSRPILSTVSCVMSVARRRISHHGQGSAVPGRQVVIWCGRQPSRRICTSLPREL